MIDETAKLNALTSSLLAGRLKSPPVLVVK
jgi:hypothetical protein